ncbi:methyltransferase [Legionella santicrucis]|uniref:Methyltransferase n=1 Tax=Legionella santicrucis TaxID=45074 RepID=A0A0W0YA37_9GAMM|nr:class I SAM-dependent methyltransferase [Legionella santicrucis]KTD53793.1 methyltransferase [Legionella santicrucis]
MSNSFANKIKKAYDNIAKIWHEKRDWYIEQPSIDEMITQLHSGATILDVGCGSGKPIAAYLKNHGFPIYGLDISPKQIEYAKQIIPEKNLFIADIFDFSTKMRFDAIVCWFMLFHIHASLHETVLKKFYDLLKPEGLLLITFADTSHPIENEFKIIDDCTIESEMFGEYFYHSGQPTQQNSQRILNTGFSILSDKMDQPGNQVILAKKEVT